MTSTAAINMLFGAALVALGVLAAALADRIRGLRAQRTASRELTPRPPARAPRAPIEVVEAELVAPRVEPKPKATSSIADDVIAALVAAGYKKQIATEAAYGCGQADRVSIENWTRAALRRCAKGVAS